MIHYKRAFLSPIYNQGKVTMNIKQRIKNWMDTKVDAVGFAPVERFAEAPENHHPERMLRDARTVIVYGRLIPKGVTKSPDYGKYFLHRSYHTVYPYLDELGFSLTQLGPGFKI